MEMKRCIACGEAFCLRAQRPDQQFCSALACQRERKRRWQRARLRSDPDYRENQARAQRAWVKRNGDYWSRYRQRNRAYAEANRAQQRKRDARSSAQGGLAKMDVWTVEIRVVSTP